MDNPNRQNIRVEAKYHISRQLLIGLLTLSIVPLLIVGVMAYSSGRQTVLKQVKSHLQSVAILKANAIEEWTKHQENTIKWITRTPHIVEQIQHVIRKKNLGMGEYQDAVKVLSDYFNQIVSLNLFSHISVIDPETSQILVSSSTDWQGKFREHDDFFIQGKKGMYISEIFQSLSMGRPTMVFSMPVRNREGRLISVLEAHANFEQLSRIMLERSGLSQTTETFLVNKSNLLITDTVFAPDGAFKKWIFGDGARRAIAGENGIGVFSDYRNVQVIGAYLWLSDRKLALIAKQDASEAFAPFTALGFKVAMIGLLISILVLISGIRFARTITNPIQKLVAGAKKIGTGDLGHRLGSLASNEIGILSTAFDQMAESLEKITTSNDEKEILLREIHHRVKNNLQMIQSLLNLQINQSRSHTLKNQLSDSINRIYSISLVHETLYQSDDLSMVDLNAYFTSLTRYLSHSLQIRDSNIKMDCHIEQMSLDLDVIITCGLIINELVTNSLKYAFKDSAGRIRISLNRLGNKQALLMISDNGMGISDSGQLESNQSLGLKLVRSLVYSQLEGFMEIDSRSGLIFTIQFPITD